MKNHNGISAERETVPCSSLADAFRERGARDHFCFLCHTSEEWLAGLVSFFAGGLRRREKCIYLAGFREAGEIRRLLSAGGLEAAAAENARQLMIYPFSEVHPPEGPPEIGRMIAFLVEQTGRAVREGRSALRVALEMDWLLPHFPDSQLLVEYEARLNRQFAPGFPCSALCQYDRNLFSPEIIKGIILTHPFVVKSGRVYRNFYYLEPEEYFASRRVEHEVLHILATLENACSAQRRLQESEKIYRTIFETTGTATVMIEEDSVMSLVNAEFVRLSGYSKEELEGKKSWMEFVVEEDLESMKDFKNWRRPAPGPVPRNYEFRLRDRQGQIKDILITTAVVPGFKKSVASLLDITARKNMESALRAANEELEASLEELTAVEEELRAQLEEIRRKEEALRESERRFRTVLENLPLIAVLLDREGRIIFCNDYLLELSGRSGEEVTGRDYFDLFLPGEFREETRKEFHTAIDQGFLASRFTNDILTADGKRRLVSWSSFLLFDHEGSIQGAAYVGEDITERRPAEELAKILAGSSPLGIYIIQDGRFQFLNPGFSGLTGYASEEMAGKDCFFLVHPADKNRVRKNAVEMLQGKRAAPYEYRFIGKGGEIRWVMEKVASVPYRGKRAVLGYYMDVTERKQLEEALRESELKLRTLFEETLNPIFVVGEDGRYLKANRAGLDFLECSREALPALRADIFPPAVFQPLKEGSPPLTAPFAVEADCLVNGKRKALLLNVVPLQVNGKTLFYGIGQDYTARKQAEEKLQYLGLHDPLTGLHNRACFEEEMRRLGSGRSAPVGIIVGDVDGLKLVNDTLGHDAGDALLVAAAGVLKSCFRGDDLVARIGGDEFAVVLAKSPRPAVESACRRIRAAVARYNEANPKFPLSISIGFAVADRKAADLFEIFKEADNNMYREKLYRSRSARSAVVQTLMKTLEARDFLTEGHGERLQKLVVSLAEAAGLPEIKMTDLRLLAQFHDIGKVGVPDRVLFKPGPLTPEERSEMQRHCEIGHRIAMTAPDLAAIADWVLKHHEWWNGQGYPLGLRGEEIPLECRVLAIADAYDAMTSDRPYRKALPRAEALKELKRCAGTQFDPRLVEVFRRIWTP